MAAKNGIKGAGVAAAENLLKTFMPQLMQKLEGLEKQFTHLDERIAALEKRIDARTHELEIKIDARVHELEVNMYQRFEATRDVINEVYQRITEVDGRLKAYVDITRDQSAAYKDLIERVVRMETIHEGTKPSKLSRRRAG